MIFQSIWKVLVYKLISSGNHSTRSLVTPKKSGKKFLGEKFLQAFQGGGLHWDPRGHWPKKIFQIFTWQGSIYMFFGTRNSLVYVKICQDYQKPHFSPKMAKLSFNWTLIGLIGKKSKNPYMNVPGTSGFHQNDYFISKNNN